MAELKMEIVLAAVDRVTTMLRGIDGSISKTKKNISDYKKRVRDLNTGIPLNGPLSKQQQRDQQELDRTNRLIDMQQKRLKNLYKLQAHRNSGKELMGAGTMQMAAATAMGYGVSRFMAEGMDFEETMSRVQALTRLEKDSPMLAALNENAKYLGATTWADPKQVAEGQAFYAMAGFKPEDIINSMAGTLDLARASGIDIGRAADIGSNILSAFGLDAKDMDRVGDILVGTFTRTNTNMEMLGDTMRYVAPIAKELGVSLEETSAMAGILGNVGIQGTQAGTAMRAMLSRLAAGPSMARKELKKLNINTSDKNGNMKDPVTLLTEVLEKTSKMGNSERLGILKSIAGQEAASAFAALLDKGNLDDLKKLIAELRNNTGESKKLAKVMADNLSGDIQELNSAWSDFKIAVFELNSGGLRNSFQWLTRVMTSIGNYAKNNPEAVSFFSKSIASVIALTAALGGLKLAFGALKYAVLGHPILAALGLAVVLGWQIHQNFDAIMELWNDSKAFRAIASITAIATALGLIWGFGTKLTALALGATLLKTGGALTATSLSLAGVATGIKAIGIALLASPFVAITLLATAIYMVYDNWESLVWLWEEGIDSLIWHAGRFWNAFQDWGEPVIAWMTDAFEGIANLLDTIFGKTDNVLANEVYRNANIDDRFGITNEQFHNLSPDEQAAMLHVKADTNTSDAEQLANVRRMMESGSNRQITNTQNQSFEIHITAPDGNAQSIAQAVQRGIASVTKKDSALLGDLR